MKILVICQHYWPEPYPLPDLCEELVRRGHTVDVITDVPNYPMGITYPEYRRGARRRVLRQVGDLRVVDAMPGLKVLPEHPRRDEDAVGLIVEPLRLPPEKFVDG